MKFREVTLGLASVAALLGAAFAVADLFHAIHQAEALYSVGTAGLSIEADLQDFTQESRRVFVYALTTPDPNVQLPYVDQARAADKKVVRSYRAFATIQLNEAARKQLDQFDADWKAYLTVRDQMIGYILEDRSDLALREEQSQGAPTFERCARHLENLKQLLDEYARNQLVAVQKTYYRCAAEVGFLIFTLTLLFGSVRLLSHLRRKNKELTDSEALERQRSEILHSISINSPLEAIFAAVGDLIQQRVPQSTVAIGMLERDKVTFSSAPGLSGELAARLDRVAENKHSPTTRAVGGCATVLCGADELVKLFAGMPQVEVGPEIRGWWSIPIRGSQRRVLGTLDVLFAKGCPASDEMVRFIERTAQLAALAVEHKLVNDQLTFQAQHDSLTGLPNRAMFQDRLERAIARASAEKKQLAVLWIDLDRFKQVNDELGHQAGDVLLQKIARRLGHCITESEMVARVGGDEFVVLLQNGDDRKPYAIQVAECALQRLNEPVLALQHEVTVGASIGISIFPLHGEDRETLLRNADTAMYSVKFEGKNAYRVYDPTMGAVCSETLELDRQLRIALQEKQFTLHYQPQVAGDGSIRCVEALLRWTSPTLGSVSPARFIPIAEENGMIVPLGAWVLREACFQAAAWCRAGSDTVRVAVNVSAHQFVRPDFAETVASALRESGLTPHLLELELTETSVVRNLEGTIHQFQKLRQLGIRISIDDFGTGLSSLSYLHQLPVDALKIDRAFVEGLGRPGRDSLLLVRAIVGMAHGLQLEVVAEGVQTQAQLKVLQNESCDLHQGFLFYKPMPADQLREALSTKPFWPGYIPEPSTNDLLAMCELSQAGSKRLTSA